MKNYELLDMVGDVNEEYVQAADDNVIRPRFRWKTLAACAACAALALGAYPVYQAANPPLHGYVVMEGARADETLETALDEGGGAPADGPLADSAPEATMEVNGFAGSYDAGAAPVYGEQGEEDLTKDGVGYSAPAQDAPVQEKAAEQYDNFWRNLGLNYALGFYPEWCAGVWIDNDAQPEPRLAVAVVEGFRTPELEAQIIEGSGGEVTFKDAKYSWSHLEQLMDSVGELLDNRAPEGVCFGFGIDVTENCLTVDAYGGEIPKDVLAALARLDPDGDAVRVRVFPGTVSTRDYDETAMKDPASADSKAIATPSSGSAQPAAEPSTAPGGVTRPEGKEFPEAKETGRPAHYDLLPAGE